MWLRSRRTVWLGVLALLLAGTVLLGRRPLVIAFEGSGRAIHEEPQVVVR